MIWIQDGRKKAAARAAASLSNAIPDDWDEETSSGEEDNQIIWDNACDIFLFSPHTPPCVTLNSRVSYRNKQVPMPQLVVTSPRAGSITPSVVVPPASAFQSPIRILKRSTATAPTQNKSGGDASDSSSPSSPASAPISSAAGSGTFAERSARYNAARERIFAAGTTETAGAGVESNAGKGVMTGGPAVSAVIRNPKGPEPAQGPNGQGREGSQGFGIRTGKRRAGEVQVSPMTSRVDMMSNTQ